MLSQYSSEFTIKTQNIQLKLQYINNLLQSNSTNSISVSVGDGSVSLPSKIFSQLEKYGGISTTSTTNSVLLESASWSIGKTLQMQSKIQRISLSQLTGAAFTSLEISNLDQSIQITLPRVFSTSEKETSLATEYQCLYFDKSSSQWLSDGVSLSFSPGSGFFQCNSLHLTEFSIQIIREEQINYCGTLLEKLSDVIQFLALIMFLWLEISSCKNRKAQRTQISNMKHLKVEVGYSLGGCSPEVKGMNKQAMAKQIDNQTNASQLMLEDVKDCQEEQQPLPNQLNIAYNQGNIIQPEVFQCYSPQEKKNNQQNQINLVEISMQKPQISGRIKSAPLGKVLDTSNSIPIGIGLLKNNISNNAVRLMPICSVFAQEIDEVKGPVILFPRSSRIHSLIATIIYMLLFFQLSFLLTKGKQWISIPLALLISWIFNYVRAFIEATQCIRSFKISFWKFEENSCLKALFSIIFRLLHCGVLYGIMLGIDIALNKNKYNLKLMNFIVCISILILSDIVIFDLIAVVLAAYSQSLKNLIQRRGFYFNTTKIL